LKCVRNLKLRSTADVAQCDSVDGGVLGLEEDGRW